MGKLRFNPAYGAGMGMGLFGLAGAHPAGATYYVDATGGNDANDGRSITRPWKTIAKVNTSTFQPGDRIRFKRDETWREQLSIPSPGAAGRLITFDAYGVGDDPKVYGSGVPASWTQEIVGGVISKVQGAFNGNAAGAAATANWGAVPTAGNLMVAVGIGTNNISNASITGWTLAVSVQRATTAYLGIWYKVAGAGEGNVTLNWTGSTFTSVTILEWASVNTLDKTASVPTTGGTVTSRSSGTTAVTAVADELCIASIGVGNTTTAQSWSNSFTDEYSPDTDLFYVASRVVASTGAYETTCSWTTARVAGGAIATFSGSGATTLYYTAQATEPDNIWFIALDGTIHRGAKQTNKVDLAAEYDWWFDDPNNRIYVYAATDPITRYSSVEVPARERCIRWLAGQNYEYAKVDGFDVAFCSGVGIVLRGHSRITNNHIHHVGVNVSSNSEGAEIQSGTNSVVSGNTIHDIVYGGVLLVASTDPFLSAGNIVESNTIYDCGRALVEVRVEATTLQSSGNVIRYNNLYHTAGFTPEVATGYGIYVFGLIGLSDDATEIYYNLLNVKKAGIYLYNYVTDALVYNNSVKSASGIGIFVDATGTSGIRIKNNNGIDSAVATLKVDAIAAIAECDYNCWYATTGTVYATVEAVDYEAADFAAYQAATGWDTNGLWENPLVVGAADFHLQAGSPCRAAGVDVGLTRDYAGVAVPQEAAPAIGAYEYTP